MESKFSVILVLIFLVPGIAFSHSNQAEKELEMRILELEERIVQLEKLLNDRVTLSEIDLAGNSNDLRNWRSLETGMSFKEVRKILGEPIRIDGGSMTEWEYPKRGSLLFFDGKLERWSEPRI